MIALQIVGGKNTSARGAATQITVVQNWFEELKQKVPVK